MKQKGVQMLDMKLEILRVTEIWGKTSVDAKQPQTLAEPKGLWWKKG